MLPGCRWASRSSAAAIPAAWIGGALLGYGLTQLAIWLVIESRLASAGTFVARLAGPPAARRCSSRAAGRRARDLAARVDAADTPALLLVLVLVPVLMGPPYANLGRADAEGNRYYRAYFTADFLWHSALAFELGKFSLPPRNPYLTPRAMNYYWTYFLLPATAAELLPPSPAGFVDLQRYLKANAILSGLLMMGALFLLVRSAVPSAWARGARGGARRAGRQRRGALRDRRSRPPRRAAGGAARHEHRCHDRVVLQRPARRQHPAIALVHAAAHDRRRAGPGRLARRDRRRRRRRRSSAIAGAGLALGLPTTMNPLLGGCFSLVYGVGIAADAIGVRTGSGNASRGTRSRPCRWSLAVAWGCGEQGHGRRRLGAPDRLLRDLAHTARSSRCCSRSGRSWCPRCRACAACRAPRRGRSGSRGAGIVLGLFLLYFVRISEASWVGFRAGQILLVSIPILLARTFDVDGPAHARRCSRRSSSSACRRPSIDTWNAQDIGNRRAGPGFRWTLWTTPDQQQAFAGFARTRPRPRSCRWSRWSAGASTGR